MDSVGSTSYKPEVMCCSGIQVSSGGIKCMCRTKHSLKGLNSFFYFYRDQGKEVYQDNAC